jgi:Domain of unknown function (DUF4406)
MKLYISGPMTGYDNLNYPAFEEAAGDLRAYGYEVISPHELNPITATDWKECMKVDIRALLDCDGVATLPGHEKSKGAILENTIAAAMGLEIRQLADWI